MSVPIREVVVVTTVTVITRTPTTRWHYKDMSETEILEYERGQETDTLLEEFVKDVESTPKEQLAIVRKVRIEDKQ